MIVCLVEEEESYSTYEKMQGRALAPGLEGGLKLEVPEAGRAEPTAQVVWKV